MRGCWRALLALMLLAPGAGYAESATDEVLQLLRERREALVEEFGQQRLGAADSQEATQIAALSRRAMSIKRKFGPRSIPGPWQELAAKVAGRLSEANGWRRYEVDVSDLLEPGIGIADGRLLISRLAIALTRNEDELASLLVWPLAQHHAFNRDALREAVGTRTAFKVVAGDPWLDQAEKMRQETLKFTLVFAGRLLWHADDASTPRWRAAAAQFLAKAGYNADTISSLEPVIDRWGEVGRAAGRTPPSFASPPAGADPLLAIDRLPADPAYLAQIAGLPMGPIEDAPLLVGERLLIPGWGKALTLPRGFDWQPYGEGVIAAVPGLENIILQVFHAPAGKPAGKAPYFDTWEANLRPGEEWLRVAGGKRLAFGVGYSGQGITHAYTIDQGEEDMHTHLIAWGLHPTSASRRMAVLTAALGTYRDLDVQDRQDLAPRMLSLRTLTSAEEAEGLMAEMSAETRALTAILNDLPPGELPLGQVLKLITAAP